MKLQVACVLALVLFGFLPALAIAAHKVPVFVKSGAGADGFSDPSKGRADSVKDLLNNLKDSKVVSVAKSEGDVLNAWGTVERKESDAAASVVATGPAGIDCASAQRDPGPHVMAG
jgi:hypothetical protein